MDSESMIPPAMEFSLECFYGTDVDYIVNTSQYRPSSIIITYSFVQKINNEEVPISKWAGYVIPFFFDFGLVIIAMMLWRIKRNYGKTKADIQHIDTSDTKIPKALQQIRKNKADIALFKWDRILTLLVVIAFFMLGRMGVLVLSA